MSRYTAEELRGMAEHAQMARDRGSPRWVLLVFQMMLRTGLTQSQVEAGIAALARAPAPAEGTVAA